MTTTQRPDRTGRRRAVPMPDFGARDLGPHPQQTMRVLGLVRAGHSYRHLVDVGHYQGSWDEADVLRILDANHTTCPGAPTATRAAQRTAAGPRTTPRTRPLPLPARQLAVCQQVVQGWTNPEIAADLGIHESTIKADVRTIIRRSGCRDRIALVIAYHSGTLRPVPEDDHDA